MPGTCLAQSYGGTGPSQGLGNAGGLGSPSGVPGHHSGGEDEDKDKPKDKPEAPPAAIPGAEPDADASIIPADRLAAEMSPNDALFDSITRGDLTAAKDALNRGAQLDSHNVLGQTPTDAAIDLNRNDITLPAAVDARRGTLPWWARDAGRAGGGAWFGPWQEGAPDHPGEGAKAGGAAGA